LKTVALLKAAGIDVVVDSQNLITHAKGIGVDGKTVLAGSTNLTNTSLDKNNEINALVTSPKLAKAWHDYVTSLVNDPTALHPSSTTAGKVTMLTDSAYYDQLMNLVKSSGKGDTLDVVMYCISNDPKDTKTQALLAELEAAQKRGCTIKMYLEQDASGFAPGITRDNIKVAERLKQSGIEVHFDEPDQITHAKGIVKNGTIALMGSSNWTKSDFDERHQVNWLINDPLFASTLTSWIDNKIKTESGPDPTAQKIIQHSQAPGPSAVNKAGASQIATRVANLKP
jgi:phosphatidylserine/phosphatidylglycerophosphate/cardiolipin synthase-like enzyme